MSRILVLPKNAHIPYDIERRFNVLDIDVTSHSKTYGKNLSPFFLGGKKDPVLVPDGRKAQNVENAWQYLKVYAEHLNSKSNIKKSWWEWSSEGFGLVRAVRYPMGKGAVPQFSFCAGERLPYIEARKRLYAPMYAKHAAKTKAFRVLQESYQDEETFLIIRDFDAYNHRQFKMSFDQVMNNPHRKMGHGFVLAMMLETCPTFYKQYEVHI